MGKPRVLVALFRMPYPATDGTRYKILHNVAEGLRKDFEIEFFIVNIRQLEASDLAVLERDFGKVHLFSHSKIAYLASSFPALLNGLPLQAEAFRFRDAQAWIDAHVDDYDAVYVHEIRMTEFFIRYSDDRKKRFLVDFNDAISMNYRDSVGKLSLLKKVFYRWEGKRVARYEARVLRSFPNLAVISDADRSHIASSAGDVKNVARFDVISFGAPVPAVAASCDREQLFFMGSLDYEPNRDALDHFLKVIWPEARKRFPNLECLVVGGGAVPERLKEIPGVRFLGFIPNVFDAVRNCRALVAPIRFAGGTPTKIIEAMGYGIPVITTPVGAAGISGTRDGENILTISESDTDQWASSIGRVLNDAEFRDRLAANGRELVMAHYSKESAQEAWGKRFREITG